jgi:hypothetical protein
MFHDLLEAHRFSAASSDIGNTGFSLWGRAAYLGTFAVIVLSLASASPFAAQKLEGASFTENLPPGAMQAKATTSCLECHEARIILQQRLSKGAWAKEVDKMMKWGAVVDPADHDALVDYFSTNFSPDKPPYEPPRTSIVKVSTAESSTGSEKAGK